MKGDDVLEITIQYVSLEHRHTLIRDIYEKYWMKIKKIKKTKSEIELINGDRLRFISTRKEKVDGLRSDVAIGPDAERITLSSNHERPAWDFIDLNNYLKNI